MTNRGRIPSLKRPDGSFANNDFERAEVLQQHFKSIFVVDDGSNPTIANHRCAVGLLPLLREEFQLLKLILHSELRGRAASRRALPCPSSFY